eukprot:Sspe_Gene.23735::Locus_9270_Transcript_9_10_Confidence_0.108_Length_2234::g.23735::m.23735
MAVSSPSAAVPNAAVVAALAAIYRTVHNLELVRFRITIQELEGLAEGNRASCQYTVRTHETVSSRAVLRGGKVKWNWSLPIVRCVLHDEDGTPLPCTLLLEVREHLDAADKDGRLLLAVRLPLATFITPVSKKYKFVIPAKHNSRKKYCTLPADRPAIRLVASGGFLGDSLSNSSAQAGSPADMTIVADGALSSIGSPTTEILRSPVSFLTQGTQTPTDPSLFSPNAPHTTLPYPEPNPSVPYPEEATTGSTQLPSQPSPEPPHVPPRAAYQHPAPATDPPPAIAAASPEVSNEAPARARHNVASKESVKRPSITIPDTAPVSSSDTTKPTVALLEHEMAPSVHDYSPVHSQHGDSFHVPLTPSGVNTLPEPPPAASPSTGVVSSNPLASLNKTASPMASPDIPLLAFAWVPRHYGQSTQPSPRPSPSTRTSTPTTNLMNHSYGKGALDLQTGCRVVKGPVQWCSRVQRSGIGYTTHVYLPMPHSDPPDLKRGPTKGSAFARSAPASRLHLTSPTRERPTTGPTRVGYLEHQDHRLKYTTRDTLPRQAYRKKALHHVGGGSRGDADTVRGFCDTSLSLVQTQRSNPMKTRSRHVRMAATLRPPAAPPTCTRTMSPTPHFSFRPLSAYA